MDFFLTRLSSSIAQINEAQVLKISAARDLVLMLYSYNKENKIWRASNKQITGRT